MNALIELARTVMGTSSGDTDQMLQLGEWLGVSLEDLRQIPADRRLQYRPFHIAKRQGGRRRILEPSGRLKQFQRALLKQYLNHLPVHYAAKAFRQGHSVAQHARVHTGQAIVLTCDLAGFFENTSRKRIQEWFRSEGWTGEPLRILMRLCVSQGGLPQGAPTSPALSNLVNDELDTRISEIAAKAGACYSRYADDLAFSWSTPTEPRAFRREVESCLVSFGYDIQSAKGWRLQRAAEYPEVTGIALHGRRLRPSRATQRRWKMLRSWWSRSVRDAARLNGMKGFLDSLR